LKIPWSASYSETRQFVAPGVTLAFQARIKGVTEGDMPIHNGTDTVIVDGVETPVNDGTETVASTGTEVVIDDGTEMSGNNGMDTVIDRGCFPRQQAKMPENN
jgi:hypothetical protein